MKFIVNCLLVVSLLSFALFSGFACTNSFEKSDGVREAQLSKLSNKGLFVKSWEGELWISAVAPWAFTVRDTTLGQRLQEHVGCPVKVGYVEYLTMNPFLYGTSFEVIWFECGTHQGRCSK